MYSRSAAALIALLLVMPPAEAVRNLGRGVSLVEFLRQNPCPANNRAQAQCPGYVIGYATPLCAGGADDISNLRWFTTDEARERERQEGQICRIEKRE